MSTIWKVSAVFFATSVLASCVPTAQANYAPGGSGVTGDVVGAVNQISQADEQSVRACMAPPIFLKYDAQMAALAAEAPEIRARQDKVRAHAWAKKMSTLMAAKNAAEQKFAAGSIARNNAIASELGGGKPNPCLDPMGRNICSANAPSGATYSGSMSPILRGLFFTPNNGGDIGHICGSGETPVSYGPNGEPIC